MLFFFTDTSTTVIYTLSLHDALPISLTDICSTRSTLMPTALAPPALPPPTAARPRSPRRRPPTHDRSEEHTSELQSQSNLVCRLLLEKKKTIRSNPPRLYDAVPVHAL